MITLRLTFVFFTDAYNAVKSKSQEVSAFVLTKRHFYILLNHLAVNGLMHILYIKHVAVVI